MLRNMPEVMLKNMPVISELTRDAQNVLGHEIDDHRDRLRILSSKKQIIHFSSSGGEKVVYNLLAGEVEIRNVKNNLIALNVSAPAILGLSNMFVNDDFYYIKTVTDVEFMSLPLSTFVAIVDKKNLWRHISVIMSLYITIYSQRNLILSQSNAYNVIKNHLEILWELQNKDGDGFNDVSVFEFILNRIPISRSSLNKVLKDLSSGGYIKLNRGKLTFMGKLPSGY